MTGLRIAGADTTVRQSPAGLRLHLGCGMIRVPGFVNVDIKAIAGVVDVADDIRTLGRFSPGSASTIYACHVLEHFAHRETLPILRRWFEVLAPGGELRISVPDMDRIVRIYTKNWEHFQTRPNTPWDGLIYGGQEDEFDFHKAGFNFCYLSHLMEQVGFIDVREYPHAPHWLGIHDASLASEPFGEYLSLNVMGRKPA